MVDNSNHLYECLKDRIAFILEKEHQTVGAFASKIGVQWQTARNIVVGRNKPGAELLLKIVNAYDDYENAQMEKEKKKSAVKKARSKKS